MKESITIPRNIPAEQPINFELLRSEGLRHVENLGGKLWTDYNHHDPGMTTLDLLCYAITDLGLRTALPIQDILAEEKDNLRKMHEYFQSALEILPGCPLTEKDYRKLFINIDGVKNAWLEIHRTSLHLNYKEQPAQLSCLPFLVAHDQTAKFPLQGIYNIIIEAEESIAPANYPALQQRVRDVFHDNRNLCEDLNEVRMVDQQRIAVCAEIELETDADAEAVHAQILFEIQQYLTPSVPFHTLQEMLDRGKTTDEIFEGPLFKKNIFSQKDFARRFLEEESLTTLVPDYRDFLENIGIPKNQLNKPDNHEEAIRSFIYETCFCYGFIDNEELDKAGLRKEVRTSDLIQIIMDIEGVRFVRDIYLDFCKKVDLEGKEVITGDQTEWQLCISPGQQPVLCTEKTVLNYYKDILLLRLNEPEAQMLLDGLNEAERAARKAVKVEDLEMPTGSYQEIHQYASIQNDFPDNYGINRNGLPDNATTARKAQAKQLKAYLVFFDQILANYFAQLSQVKTLLAADDSVRKTYFTQAVKDVRDIEQIYRNFTDDADLQTGIDTVMASLDDYPKRKQKMLDHLLARFAEQFNEYVFLMHELYGKYIDNTLIKQKVTFLKEYPEISAKRAAAYDYYHPQKGVWNTYNVSGMQHRLARLGGFRDYMRRNFLGVDYEIYQEEDPDHISEYRWRVRDDKGKIVLSSSLHYLDKEAAITELEVCMSKAGKRSNYKIKRAKDKTYHFVLEDETKEIIARRIEYFAKRTDAVAARDYTADFLKDKKLTVEGMYLVEHLLLRPEEKAAPPDQFLPICVEPDFTYCQPLDPYSFRISIVLPGWTQRFARPEFRQFMEKLIRLETPAHIMAKICWIGRDQMKEFEVMYRAWLNNRHNKTLSPAEKAQVRKDFIQLLSELYTIYPEGKLHDCVDEGTEEKDNPVILNRTNLGSLGTQNPEEDPDKPQL